MSPRSSETSDEDRVKEREIAGLKKREELDEKKNRGRRRKEEEGQKNLGVKEEVFTQ